MSNVCYNHIDEIVDDSLDPYIDNWFDDREEWLIEQEEAERIVGNYDSEDDDLLL